MKSVLIADDESLILRAMAITVKAQGLTVLTATSGAQAIALYEQNKPGYALLDLNLGDMTGLDVLAEIKKINPKVKAYIVTAEDRSNFAERAESLGVTGYVGKPLDREKLKTLVDTFLKEPD